MQAWVTAVLVRRMFPTPHKSADSVLFTGKLLNTEQVDKIIASYPGGLVRYLFYPTHFDN